MLTGAYQAPLKAQRLAPKWVQRATQEPLMVVGSISYTVVNVYAATAAATAPAAAPAPAPAPIRRDADDDHHGHHGHHGHHRRGGGIVEAVRTALRELLPAAAPAPAAAAAAAPAAPAPRAHADADDFAHALWRALRDAPTGAQARMTERRYGDLPQRLETLAASLDTPAGAAASPLVEAFGSMLQSLRGGTGEAGDARSLLAGFLHRIAAALGGGTGTAGAAPTGQLVSTSA